MIPDREEELVTKRFENQSGLDILAARRFGGHQN